MLLILGLQAAILLGIVLLMLRKNPIGPISASLQVLAERTAEMNARGEHVETSVQGIRADLTSGMGQSRDDASRFFEQVRRESTDLRELVTQRHAVLLENINTGLTAIGQTLLTGQATQSADTLTMKETVETTLSQLGRDLRENTNQLTDEVKSRLTEVAGQVNALSEANERRQETLRQTVEGRLETLQQSNTSKLEEMRATVDEKLHSTLERRLTESFSMVAERLENVQTGLGEMKELAVGVGDLKRVLTNVRARGSMGETQCGAQLDQVLAPDQYIRDAVIKEGSNERVEFAIRIPNDYGEMLLPIDVKFPKEDWERLEDAMDRSSAEDSTAARKSLAATVRNEAKKICDKYIDPPRTTPIALMYLPTEGLFAEVIRIPGLIDELQTRFNVLGGRPDKLHRHPA